MRDSLKRKIQSLYQTEESSELKNAEAGFNLTLNARLENYPSYVARALHETLVYRTRIETRPKIEGEFSPESNSIRIGLPKELQGTEVQFFILTHELEHWLQDFRKRIWVVRAPEFMAEFFHPMAEQEKFAERRFLEEAGAMMSEYHYAMALPNSVRRSTLEKLRSSSASNAKDFLPSFVDTPSSVLEYLNLQWASGRYSWGLLTRQQWAMTGQMAAGGYHYLPLH